MLRGGGAPKRKPKHQKKAVKVSVPYAPTKKGKEAEERDRGHVTAPYAPTPTGKAAERKAEREEKAKRRYRKAVRKAPVLRPGTKEKEDPVVGSVLETLRETYENTPALRPGVDSEPAGDFAKDELANVAEVAKESLKPGRAPIHVPDSKELQAALTIASLASGGPVAKLGEKVGARAIAAASDSKFAARALRKVAKAPGEKAAEIKGAPKRAARRLKETPDRVRTAPRRARKAATTKEGRRAAAKSAGAKVYAHPVGSVGALGTATNQVGLDVPGLKQAGAFVEGHLQADPIESANTTARAIPGIVASPLALIGSAGTSVIHGTTEPLEEEASKQLSGLRDMGEKLLSGDPETVKKAVEDEVGYSVVAPAPALSRVTKTSPYKGVRGKARDAVEVRREATRAKRRAELADFKSGKRTKRAKKIRHAVLDTETGEARILRRTGKAIEGHRQRKAVSKDMARRKAQGERAALLASKEVIKHVRRSKLSKGAHNVGDALATVAQYGISRDRAKAEKQLDEIEASIGSLHPDELPAGTINDLTNVRWLRKHPEAFADKHFWNAVDAYKKQAREIEHSGRKKVLAVGDVYGIARPEERLEAGVTVGGRKVRGHFYKQSETLQRKQAELAELRHDAKMAEQGALRAKPDEKARYGRVAAEIQARAKVLERELKDYRSGMKQAQKDYVREAQATIREKGLEQPAYVKDVKPRQGLEPLPNFPGGRSARKQHMASSEQSRRGVTMARDFETLVNQSIAEPRMRRAMHEATTDFAESYATSVGGKRLLTSEEISRAINRGDLDEAQYAVLHSQFFKQAILDPHKRSEEFTDSVRSALDRPIREEIGTRAADPGNKYVVVPKETVREFVHQMEPPKGMDRLFGGANRLMSRLILGYSPAWAVAQLVAEGIPAAISVGTNPARWARVAKYMSKEERRLNQKDRAALDGTIGESAGVTPHPQVQFKPDTNMMASRFFRLSNRNRIGRALLKGATGEALGIFDRWKGGKYRKLVAAAKADRELNSVVRSLSGLMRGQRTIVEAIKGKSLKDQMEYIAKHPAEAAKLEGYLDDVMGNWRAMTRHEAKFAPLIVFYPFVRYSLRWMFWSFPKQHPVKASILYFLSQQNAEELEKLAGGPLANPLDYTFPAYTGSSGENEVLPGGSRVAPGMNALTTAVGRGQLESLATALNPAAGLAVSGVTGVDPLSGEKKAHNPLDAALLTLNQILSMPAPTRAGIPEGVPVIGGKSLRQRAMEGLGQDSPSGVSEAFKNMDPQRDFRSAVFPFAPQSGERFGDSQTLASALEDSGFDPELGDDSITRALEAVKRGDTGLAERLRKRREDSDEASDEIGRLVREYTEDEGSFPKLNDRQYEWLGKITGKRVFPYEEPEPDPFGLPDISGDQLREQFGIPSTSAAELKKQFGID